MKIKMESGEYCGGDAPYGYKRARDEKGKSTTVPDPLTAPYVVEIFEKLAAGQSYLKISREFNTTSFLDIRHKLELLAILKKMVLEKQMTVIMSLHELDLAQKISDQVICVHGDHIEKYGAPEEIFTSDYIRRLYGITRGSYNAEFGCVEMEPPTGELDLDKLQSR